MIGSGRTSGIFDGQAYVTAKDGLSGAADVAFVAAVGALHFGLTLAMRNILTVLLSVIIYRMRISSIYRG